MRTAAQPGDLVLAIDGGGTKTICRVARMVAEGAWEILGSGTAAGSNPRTAGLDGATQRIQEAVTKAQAQSGVEVTCCRYALLAIAGTLDATVRASLEQHIRPIEIADQIRVIPDLLPLVALAQGPAIGIIAGTGSVGVGRDDRGRVAIGGGWGPLLGDDGSGFAVGKEAVRGTLSQLEGGAQVTGLASAVCRSLNSGTAAEIKAVIASAGDPRGRIAAVAPIVFQQAEQGDFEAQSIVSRAAADLAKLVQQLHARLELADRELQVAVSGGLFQAGDRLAAELTRAIQNLGFDVELQRISDPTEPLLRMLADGKVPTQVEVLP